MKTTCLVACVIALFVGLSSISSGATSRIRVKSSPWGRHTHTHEHHVGRTKSCAGSIVGAARFGAIRLERSATCAGGN